MSPVLWQVNWPHPLTQKPHLLQWEGHRGHFPFTVSDEHWLIVKPTLLPRHLDVSRETQRSTKFKLTRKILTNIVQSLGNLVSLDISGHVMLDNCTVPYIEEAMGPPRYMSTQYRTQNLLSTQHAAYIYI